MTNHQTKLSPPRNQYSLCIRLLIDHKQTGVTMKHCCNVLFYKFQTRLGEIERSIGTDGKPRRLSLKIRRLPVTKRNRFGNSMTYTEYKSLASISYLKNLYSKLNREGLKK